MLAAETLSERRRKQSFGMAKFGVYAELEGFGLLLAREARRADLMQQMAVDTVEVRPPHAAVHC